MCEWWFKLASVSAGQEGAAEPKAIWGNKRKEREREIQKEMEIENNLKLNGTRNFCKYVMIYDVPSLPITPSSNRDTADWFT